MVNLFVKFGDVLAFTIITPFPAYTSPPYLTSRSSPDSSSRFPVSSVPKSSGVSELKSRMKSPYGSEPASPSPELDGAEGVFSVGGSDCTGFWDSAGAEVSGFTGASEGADA